MNWLSDRADDDLIILDADTSLTAADLAAAGQSARDSVAVRSAVVKVGETASGIAASLVGLQGWARSVVFHHASVRPPREKHLDDSLSNGQPPFDTRWVLYTSGTTGEPKPIFHTFGSLTKTVRPDPSHSRTWGLLYEPQRMAGLQVLAQVLVGGGQLVAPPTHFDVRKKVRFLRQYGVDSLSATPSLWRRILQSPEAPGWRLKQITLGGEIADQRILDSLALAFPGANITHVFAATETGAVFSVKDGLEGFPQSYLEKKHGEMVLQVRGNLLYVQAPDLLSADEEGFVFTGDVVEVRSGRVFFKGRSSGVVNVAGAKVFPEEVEALLRSHPSVLEALVQPVPNTFSGSILVAKVVPTSKASPELAGELRLWLRSQAPSHWVPAKITLVENLGATGNGKIIRK